MTFVRAYWQKAMAVFAQLFPESSEEAPPSFQGSYYGNSYFGKSYFGDGYFQ